MILFCDTSALAKLYVEEEGTDGVRRLVDRCELTAVSRIAWVEMMSALGRRLRESPGDSAALTLAKSRFVRDWPGYLALDLTQGLVELAGTYAEAFALRAYDGVQLASAAWLRRELADDDLRFACFDARLVQAATVLGIAVAGIEAA